MSKQILFLVTGLGLALTSVGCCCLGGLNKCGCGCPPTGGGGYYPPAQTGMFQAADPSQLAYSSSTTQTAYAGGVVTTAAAPPPIMGQPLYNQPPGTYSTTAMVPTASLPTY